MDRDSGRADLSGDAVIAARVRLCRIERGLSVDALARAAGLTSQQLTRCESGSSRIASQTLLKLAGPLNVSAGWLLEGDAKPRLARRPPVQAQRADGADNDMLQACLVMAEASFANLPLAIYMTNAEGLVVYANGAGAQMAGRLPRIGRDRWCITWRAYDLDGNRVAHADNVMAIALHTGKPVRGALGVIERPDGSRQAVIPFPTPLLNKKGEVFGGFNAIYPARSEVLAKTG